MYSKYALFYETPKNWGYYEHVQIVCVGGGGLAGNGIRSRSLDCYKNLMP